MNTFLTNRRLFPFFSLDCKQPLSSTTLSTLVGIAVVFGGTIGSISAQTNYYWNGTGDVKITSNWGANMDGTGTAPADFGTGKNFRITKAGADITGWNVTGNPILEASGSASATGSYSSVGNLVFDSGSQFTFSASSNTFRDTLVYGKLLVSSSTPSGSIGTVHTKNSVQILANQINVSTGSSTARIWTIGQDVIINSGATLNLADGSAASTINVSGTVTNSGTIKKSNTGAATINFVGSGAGEATWGTNSDAFVVVVGANRQMTFVDALNNSGGTLTVDGSLAGSATIAGATTIKGTHAVAGTGIASQTFSSDLNYSSGSIFKWDLNATGGDVAANASNQGSYDRAIVGGALTGGGAKFDIASTGLGFADAFWNTNKSWSDIFTIGSGSDFLASIFSFQESGDVDSSGAVAGRGQFSFTNNTLNWSAVPEPTSALAGLLLAAGLMRRRRS